jgi:hypothetical protein
MFRTSHRSVVCCVLILPFVAAIPLAAVASDVYDVSYVWTRNAEGVQDYRERVARVLGPDIAQSLQVVARDDLFGLVYPRHGDRNGTARVARVHTKLLESKGLEAAAPIRSRDWKLANEHAGAEQAQEPVSRSEPQRAPEAGTSDTRSVTILVGIDGEPESVDVPVPADAEWDSKHESPVSWQKSPWERMKELFTQRGPEL